MATINLYVSDALRHRMDLADEQNWSAVAQQAFEAHLGRLAVHGKANGKLGAAVERLKASKVKYEDEQKAEGYERGYAWAQDRAEFHDLESMVGAADYPAAVGIVQKTKSFLQRDEFGDAVLPSDEMWEGFVDGATALYNDVADQM